jgi:hypothetical protein
MNDQAPISNNQTITNNQIPISKQEEKTCLGIDYWLLGFNWSLPLGYWLLNMILGLSGRRPEPALLSSKIKVLELLLLWYQSKQQPVFISYLTYLEKESIAHCENAKWW